MIDVDLPNKILYNFDITDSDFKNLINKRCNKNLAKFLSVFRDLKEKFHEKEPIENLLISYEILRSIPQGPMSLIMAIPTFHYWIEITENLMKRIQNNECIPLKDTPHLQGINKLENNSLLKYHLLDINRFILSMSILCNQNVKVDVPIYDGYIVLPYFGINIKVNKNYQSLKLELKNNGSQILDIINHQQIDISQNIIDFQNGNTDLIDDNYISQSQSLLFSKGRILVNNYDPYYKYEIVLQYVFPNKLKATSPDNKKLKEWGKILRKVQVTLREHWPEIENIIGFYIYEIVPIKSPDPDINISCTSKLFHGAIFCSDSPPTELAEVLIHEFSHNLLNDVMQSHPLIERENSLEKKYYSPWRPDPRHLHGILHAVYVFEKVADYYLRILSNNKRISDYSYRYSLIVARLKIAIDVLIENGKFTNSGKALIKKFENKIERHLSNEKCKISLSKKEIIAHHRKWKKDNNHFKAIGVKL